MPKGSKVQRLADVMSHEQWRLDLIAAHLPSAIRQADRIQKQYPGIDAEPLACQALYLAAFTYRPGKQGFHAWLRQKMRSVPRGHLLEQQRRARGMAIGKAGPGRPAEYGPPIRIHGLNAAGLDLRLSYRDDLDWIQ